MPETESTISKVLGVLGWVVAALTLGISWAQFQDARQDREKAVSTEPVFSTSLQTYDPSILPAEIAMIKQAIRHRFTVTHVSGKAVEKLSLVFESPHAAIIGVEILSGQAGARVTVAPNKRESIVERERLIRGETLSGFVVTEGLAQVNMRSDASNGREASAPLPTPTAGPGGFDWSTNILVSLYVIALIAGVVVTLLVLRARMRREGFLGEDVFFGGPWPLFVSILVTAVVLEFLPQVGFATLWRAFIAYLLIVNYGRIVRAIDAVAQRAELSRAHGSNSANETEGRR